MSPADCHPDRPHVARGLCRQCYRRAEYDGTLDQHQGRRWQRPRNIAWARTSALAEDALFVLDCTCRCHRGSHAEIHGTRVCHCGGLRVLADRLGVSRDALKKALQRARAHGLVAA